MDMDPDHPLAMVTNMLLVMALDMALGTVLDLLRDMVMDLLTDLLRDMHHHQPRVLATTGRDLTLLWILREMSKNNAL